jgi:hypothetical protein
MSLTAAEIEQDYNLYSKDLNVRGAHGVPGYTLLPSERDANEQRRCIADYRIASSSSCLHRRQFAGKANPDNAPDYS